jgi:hypothetical protein
MEQSPFEKLIAWLVRNSPRFTELKGSLPCWQQPANGPYSESDKSSPHPHILISKGAFGLVRLAPSCRASAYASTHATMRASSPHASSWCMCMPLPIHTRIEAHTLFSVFKPLFFFDIYLLCTCRKYDRRLFILFRAAFVVPISYLFLRNCRQSLCFTMSL